MHFVYEFQSIVMSFEFRKVLYTRYKSLTDHGL